MQKPGTRIQKYRLELGEDVGASKIIAVLLAMGMHSGLDVLTPEGIPNPVEISKLGVSRNKACRIIDMISECVCRWENLADMAGVSERKMEMIRNTYPKI